MGSTHIEGMNVGQNEMTASILNNLLRLFQNFSFWNSYLKNPQFCRPQAKKLQEPVTKQPVLEQARVSKLRFNQRRFCLTAR
jgi:hypothetical protein